MKKITFLFIITISFYTSVNAQNSAISTLMTSAENGDVSAQTELAIKYIEGDGVNKNYIEAAKWFKKAAEQGYAKAQYNLGVCYENGQGVNKNISEAKKWYMRAAIQGDEFAKEALKRLGEDF